MIERTIPVRAVERAFGIGFAGLSMLAILRLGELTPALFGIVLWALGYVSSRAVPDVRVSVADLWRVCAMALALLLVGLFGVGFGNATWLDFTAAVLAYASGNRLRASAWGRES